MDNLDKLKIAQQDILKTIPTNKRDATRMAAMVITSILDGDVNPLETDIKLRFLEELIKRVRTNVNIKEAILEEAEKYPEKTFIEYGAEITKSNLGVKYDFSQCQDSKHVALLDQIAELTDAKKKREAFLKGIDGETADPDTGEVIYPPIKTSTSGVKVKLL